MKKLLVVLLFGLTVSALALADPPEVIDYYAPAMHTMHETMMGIKPTGNADIDFVREMIPHHQAAVDMAKIELQSGKDPQILQLARSVVANQQIEINSMKSWLAAHQKVQQK